MIQIVALTLLKMNNKSVIDVFQMILSCHRVVSVKRGDQDVCISTENVYHALLHSRKVLILNALSKDVKDTPIKVAFNALLLMNKREGSVLFKTVNKS